jgi:hypothetical protein
MSCEILCSPEISKTVENFLKPDDYLRVRMTTQNIDNFKFGNGVSLVDKLLALQKDGIIITIVIGKLPGRKDRKHLKRDLFIPLIKKGFYIYYNPKVHLKMILIESKTYKNALLMSSNISRGGLFYRFEVGVSFLCLDEIKFKKLDSFFDHVVGDEETRELKDVI